MCRTTTRGCSLALVGLCFLANVVAAGRAGEFAGWDAVSPRPEIRPQFSRGDNGGLVIAHDQREGLDGWFEQSFSVKGGEYYRFSVQRKSHGVENPRQSCLVRIRWQDDRGRLVTLDAPTPGMDSRLPLPSAEPEYPADAAADAEGVTSVSGVYRSPSRATRAVVEMHLQWAPGGRVEWYRPEFIKTAAPAERRVRLATVHYKPSGKSPQENCREFAPLLKQAAEQQAELVVLGETVPSAGVNASVEDIAEPIPGPSTEYFGAQAKAHRLHIVFSLYERDAHLIYNTAVLLGTDGQLIGKYRKVSLPPGEAAKGIAPGKSYPVFDTPLGKIGMMICYDGFFPEVARELTKNGAEIIAWPVWGCNPKLAEARACENHVYVVSSTFMKPDDGWMYSAIYDRGGQRIATGEKWGTVTVAEVALGIPYYGPYNLGDFHSMIPRHRPPVPSEPTRR